MTRGKQRPPTSEGKSPKLPKPREIQGGPCKAPVSMFVSSGQSPSARSDYSWFCIAITLRPTLSWPSFARTVLNITHTERIPRTFQTRHDYEFQDIVIGNVHQRHSVIMVHESVIPPLPCDSIQPRDSVQDSFGARSQRSTTAAAVAAGFLVADKFLPVEGWSHPGDTAHHQRSNHRRAQTTFGSPIG